MRYLLLILPILALYASPLDKFLANMKIKQEYYQDKNNTLIEKKKLQKEMKSIEYEEIDETQKEDLRSLNERSINQMKSSMSWITENMITGMEEKELKKITDDLKSMGENPEQVDTIFYLFSSSLDSFSLFNFVDEAVSLEKVNPKIKYYGVVQGILNEKELNRFYKPFEGIQRLDSKAVIKMHPFIFRKLKLKEVPAILFSKCGHGNNFKFKECENKYLVRGSVSLINALGIVSEMDSSYEKYLQILEQGEYEFEE